MRSNIWMLGGLLYFMVALALGFLLGTVRTVLVVPQVGPLAAVLLELPVILVLTWWCCLQITRRLGIGAFWQERLLMGTLALMLLLTAEFLLFVFLFGNEPGLFLARSGDMAGLAGQVVFASFPMLQLFIKKRF